jgi:segregation and condensation protein B
MKALNLAQSIEAILFVAAEPVSVEQLSRSLNAPTEDVLIALDELTESMTDRGLRIISVGESFELVSHPGAAETVRHYLEEQVKPDLSKPALETLAIIAYKQPVTKDVIDEVRGVASDQSIKNLLLRGLIVEAGKSSEPGRPMQYATSHKFLKHFGLSDHDDLPPLPDAPAEEHQIG